MNITFPNTIGMFQLAHATTAVRNTVKSDTRVPHSERSCIVFLAIKWFQSPEQSFPSKTHVLWVSAH